MGHLSIGHVQSRLLEIKKETAAKLRHRPIRPMFNLQFCAAYLFRGICNFYSLRKLQFQLINIRYLKRFLYYFRYK